MSKEEYDFEGAEQGAVTRPASGKTRITIRIDTDVLEWFRRQVHDAGGGNYQLESRLIGGTHHSHYPVFTSPAQITLHQPHARHNPPIGHLP